MYGQPSILDLTSSISSLYREEKLVKDREEAWSAIQKLALQSPHVELLSNPLSVRKAWNFRPSSVGEACAGDRPPSNPSAGDRSPSNPSAGDRPPSNPPAGDPSATAADAEDDDSHTELQSGAKSGPPKVMIKLLSNLPSAPPPLFSPSLCSLSSLPLLSFPPSHQEVASV